MSETSELEFYTPLFGGLNNLYKLDLDPSPSTSRKATLPSVSQAQTKEESIIVVGGSNAGNLCTALNNMGKSVVDITS